MLQENNGNGNNKGILEVDLADVPIKVHRTAAQLLEDQVEQQEETSTWTPGASFDPNVRVLHRVDMNTPAYYEFRVAVEGERRGYIVVSSGDHDFPVPHWNSEGSSPTELLDEQAEGDEVGKYFKVDLTYVAEDSDGNILAKLGNLPLKFESDQDLEELAENADPESIETEGTPNEDEILPEEEGNRVLKKKEEEEDAPFETLPWGATEEEAWKALKADGGNNSRFLSKSLKKAAAEDWETDRLADTYGEGLIVGQKFEVALLFPDAAIQVSGRGAKHVSTEVELDEETGHQVLHVLANEADETEELSLRVRIKYGNGRMEDIQFAIVPLSEVPNDRRGLGAWSAWNYFWADGGQRIYDQFMGSPNTSSCWSGCGATAWAMLFGWVDYRASFDSKWSHRWCAYRQNGWWAGSDAVAPEYMDDGVKLMTWKIRNKIGTYCTSSGGATKFSRMLDAYKYLQGTGCGWNIKTGWDNYGYSDDLRNKAINHIVHNRTPVIVSDYNHYPLAYGYAWRKRTVRKCFVFCWNETEYSRFFYVNNGWGSTAQNGWVAATTRFAARFYP